LDLIFLCRGAFLTSLKSKPCMNSSGGSEEGRVKKMAITIILLLFCVQLDKCFSFVLHTGGIGYVQQMPRDNDGNEMYDSEAEIILESLHEMLKDESSNFSCPHLNCISEDPILLRDQYHGILGRVVILDLTNCPQKSFWINTYGDEDGSMEEMRLMMAANIDQMVNNGIITQPILLSIMVDSPMNNLSSSKNYNEAIKKEMETIIEREISEHSLCSPVSRFHEASYQFETSPKITSPSLHVQIDGANINGKWDTSDIFVFDDLVSHSLRKRLRDTVLAHSSWDDRNLGPDTQIWERGGLDDILEKDSQTECSCWGLTLEATERLCFQEHKAINEMEMLLSSLFRNSIVCRLPEAVLGYNVSPLTANAATFGDKFSWHIDADPMLNPPSPWVDVFGRYPNRSVGKPRFLSCLVYINENWNYKKCGAPTRFLDPPTETCYDVEARPGRVLIMDQDITHTVVSPNKTAGRAPRYSLVWKLIVHPTTSSQDMKSLFKHSALTKGKKIGSANDSK